jgi:hypothetical protein
MTVPKKRRESVGAFSVGKTRKRERFALEGIQLNSSDFSDSFPGFRILAVTVRGVFYH